MSQQSYVYWCKGYFEGELFELAMFDNEDAASDFVIDQEGGTYVDIHYTKHPIYSTLSQFNDR